ncbi:hypothetical protein [Nonomuraea dietziae]|uniref:Uncharacterized protein n=1 Tax=Nonomuraea dietziae TaxID=65515 RepID=A0A7W5Y7C0_9ACTN|nr:hypothetical protein [Nonomuraea dietziae]MBB3727386.1 hypothetical protein [Nonomuraea dietziae]
METAYLVEQHIYPLLAKHGIRTVQVARAGPRQKDGIVVLDDTTSPILCLTSAPGAYRLSDELLSVATVPQLGGKRKCTVDCTNLEDSGAESGHSGSLGAWGMCDRSY